MNDFLKAISLWILSKRHCNHKWDVLRSTKIYESDDISKLPIKTRLILVCKKCGEIKTVET